MIVAHVALTTAPDYLTRRAPHRQAHIERLTALRGQGIVVGGGPAPDGSGVDLVYRVPDPAALAPLVEDDPYYRAGAWTAYRARRFQSFLDPWELPPVVLDGSRRAVLVEGRVADADLAALVLVELRGDGRVAFGGLFPDGTSLALVRTADAVQATAWFAATGLWDPDSLAARPLLHVL